MFRNKALEQLEREERAARREQASLQEASREIIRMMPKYTENQLRAALLLKGQPGSLDWVALHAEAELKRRGLKP